MNRDMWVRRRSSSGLISQSAAGSMPAARPSQSMRHAPARLSHKGESVAAQLSETTSASAGQAMLTFWIPERIDALLAEHARARGSSRSDAVRAILCQYL
ncbi:MAG: ribbon-helix-helix protein, CopG family, partial [Thermomonas sp.]